MKTNKKKLDAELYNIFSEVYDDEGTRQLAMKESKIAFRLIKQEALFRIKPNIYHEL